MANESSSAKRAPIPTRGPQAPRFIVIEGPLRVGKTTLAKVLAERLHARHVYDCEDNQFLADFYNEKPGSAFRAQMYFLYERYRRLLDTRPENNPAPIVSDFLFEKDKIFAYLNLEDEELKRGTTLSVIGNGLLVHPGHPMRGFARTTTSSTCGCSRHTHFMA